MGALCTLLFAAPNSPLGQPRNILYGHLFACVVGIVREQARTILKARNVGLVPFPSDHWENPTYTSVIIFITRKFSDLIIRTSGMSLGHPGFVSILMPIGSELCETLKSPHWSLGDGTDPTP